MMPVFNTDSGLPLPSVNLAQRKGYHTTDFPGWASIAEVATLQLEFKYLSHLTGDDKYWDAVEQVSNEQCNLRTGRGCNFSSHF